jgi:hypothetical protein
LNVAVFAVTVRPVEVAVIPAPEVLFISKRDEPKVKVLAAVPLVMNTKKDNVLLFVMSSPDVRVRPAADAVDVKLS